MQELQDHIQRPLGVAVHRAIIRWINSEKKKEERNYVTSYQ